MSEHNIIGISRVRNVELVIKDVLDHLSKYIGGVIIYDDASSDGTLEILKKHPLVKELIENTNWESDRIERRNAEGTHRQLLFEKAKFYTPDWVYVFDADEFIEFKEDFDLSDKEVDSYFFRLYDYYITPNDFKKNYLDRFYVGPEYRDIPMFFRANLDLKFHSRVPSGFRNIKFGGYVKHYGKALSISEWEKKCKYYIKHLKEVQPGNIDISDKWRERLGKAVHTESDFFNKLISWEEKKLFDIELTNGLEKLTTLCLNILVASNSLNCIGGSETFTYTLIEELKKYPKFNIEYFTFEKGLVSNKIEEKLGVKYMSRKKYDLIIANHFTTVSRLYKKGIIIQTCHGIYPKLEQPNKKATGFISISQEVQNYLAENGFVSKLIYNSINLTRFYPKKDINDKPKVLLSLCHSVEANEIVKKLCKELNLEYLEAFKYKDPIWNIEDLINSADIVIGLGRSAYESMACGRPVIVYDKRKYFPSYGDGYIRENLGFSLVNNCSGRFSKKYLTIQDLKKEINKYNKEDQYFFREFSKRELDVRKNIIKYLEYYFILKQAKLEKRPFEVFKRTLKKLKIKGELIKSKIVKRVNF